MRLTFILSFILFSCQPPPADRFVEIAGKRQHILEKGHGTPAVIFVSGFGDRVSSWMHVQHKVADITQTLSYDRSGLGESELMSKNRSLDTIIFELDKILESENIDPPYVLVGHSYGGHIIRYYAHKHPEKVSGLLLVDATVEFMQEEFKRLKTADEIRKYDSLREHGKDPSWKEGVRNEADYFEENNNLIKTISFNRDIPTTVITAMNTPAPTFDFLQGANEMKLTLHKRWASEFPHIKLIYANKSGHYVQFDEPELVINEVQKLVDNQRKH